MEIQNRANSRPQVVHDPFDEAGHVDVDSRSGSVASVGPERDDAFKVHLQVFGSADDVGQWTAGVTTTRISA